MRTREVNDRIEEARVHYETRSQRRPRQTWDEESKQWVKTPV